MEHRCWMAGWVFGALTLGCSRGPVLQQPVGHSQVQPSPMPTLEGSSQDNVVPPGTAVELTSKPVDDRGPYHRLCDLPDTPAEAPHFPIDSAVLGPYGKQVLDQVANCMLRGTLADESVIVLGYADPRGPAEYNMELAMERARAVARYLVHRGVPAERVSVASRGEQYARGTGPESWHDDRRVQIELDSGQAVTRF